MTTDSKPKRKAKAEDEGTRTETLRMHRNLIHDAGRGLSRRDKPAGFYNEMSLANHAEKKTKSRETRTPKATLHNASSNEFGEAYLRNLRKDLVRLKIPMSRRGMTMDFVNGILPAAKNPNVEYERFVFNARRAEKEGKK